jgi:hypothetical protein
MQDYELHILKEGCLPSLIFLSSYPSDSDAIAIARILVLDNDSFEVWRGSKRIFRHVSLTGALPGSDVLRRG